jgi:hypothetical protein
MFHGTKVGIVFLCLFPFIAGCSSFFKSDKEIVNEFMLLRVDGKNNAAYEFLDDDTKKVYSEEDFNNYCFVFRVIDYRIGKDVNGYFKVEYTFYDKKINRKTGELHTYYITENSENIKLKGGKIVFPHIGYVELRKNIESKLLDEASMTLRKMLSIDPANPDTSHTAEITGLFDK